MIVCGCAASRAESLWLSAKLESLLAATPPEAAPQPFSKNHTESSRLSAREAVKPQNQFMAQNQRPEKNFGYLNYGVIVCVLSE